MSGKTTGEGAGQGATPTPQAGKKNRILAVITHHPIIAAVFTAVLILCLGLVAVTGAVWWQLRTTDSSGSYLPADGSPYSLLVLGIDGDNGATAGQRSDTIMLVRMRTNPNWIDIVSIPRDSLVEMPQCTGNAAGETDKLNAAFAYGSVSAANNQSPSEAGMSCAAAAITNASGVKIDDTLAVTLQGMREIIDAQGGVELPLDSQGKIATTTDEQASTQVFSGSDITRLLRARKTFDDSSDLSRIARQQKIMSAILQSVRSSGALNLANLADGSLLTTINVASRETYSTLSLNEIKDFVGRLSNTPVNAVTLPTVLADDSINVDWTDSTTEFFGAYKAGGDLPA